MHCKPNGYLLPLAMLTALAVAVAAGGGRAAATVQVSPDKVTCTPCHTDGRQGDGKGGMILPSKSSQPARPAGKGTGAAKPAQAPVQKEAGASLTRPTSGGMPARSVQVTVNGERYRQGMLLAEGRVLVPARVAADWLNAVVEWDNQRKTVSFRRGGEEVAFATRQREKEARLVGGTAYVPLRFLAERFSARVSYDPNSGITLQTGVDHSAFLTGPFQSGPEVTAACLKCHEKQAQDILASSHWLWKGPSPQIQGAEQRTDLGKINGINNFCIATPGNLTKCATCHAGYGLVDANFDFTDKSRIDCLVCHARDGGYKRTGANELAPGVNLLKAAQSVGAPTRANCGACHFSAGGGDGVKQGDMDSTLASPTREHDVHMGGANLSCQACHKTKDHQIAGISVHNLPSQGRVTCEDCHTAYPHKANATLNKHAATVACQTCHIPTFAKGMATKMSWDWSTAGQDREVSTDQYGKPTYDKMKGSFVWAKDVRPTYAWYNGKVQRYLLGDQVNRDGVTHLAKPLGSIADPQARIYPFKVHSGKQPADVRFGYLLTPKTVGGYWKDYDWVKALQEGAKASGLAFSGQYEFVPTDMYVGINHEVVPKERALTCTDCHSPNGVLDFKALGYAGDPMQVGGRSGK